MPKAELTAGYTSSGSTKQTNCQVDVLQTRSRGGFADPDRKPPYFNASHRHSSPTVRQFVDLEMFALHVTFLDTPESNRFTLNRNTSNRNQEKDNACKHTKYLYNQQ